MNLKRLLKHILFVALFFSTALFAQNNADVLLKELQSKFKSLENLSADFTQTTNGKKYLSGKIYYQKGNKLRIETKRLIIVSDGKTSWNYNKKENKVIISSYDENDPGVFSINEIVNNYPEECDVETEKINDEDVLVLIPKTYTFNFNFVKIQVNEEHLIKKISFDDSSTGKTIVTFENYKLNENLPESTFSFNPPEGSKIIDLR